MSKGMRDLTAEELMLVSGGLVTDPTIVVIGGGGGGGGGTWGGGSGGGWTGGGGGGTGGGGDGGTGTGSNVSDTDGQYWLADVNQDGKYDEHFYAGNNEMLYYSVHTSDGQQILYPVTQMSGTTGTGGTLASSIGATGGVPTAGVTYTQTTSNGTISFTLDPTHGRRVH